MINNKRIVVVMPAYNAAKTLERTVRELPDVVDHVIIVDDYSRDETVRIAKDLGLKVFAHDGNYGYGRNQQTCYREALMAGADIVVMVHPDYQYTPLLVTAMASMIAYGVYDVVLGSRIIGGGALRRLSMIPVESPTKQSNGNLRISDSAAFQFTDCIVGRKAVQHAVLGSSLGFRRAAHARLAVFLILEVMLILGGLRLLTNHGVWSSRSMEGGESPQGKCRTPAFNPTLRLGCPLEYWGLEPCCTDRLDWRIRYASVFTVGEKS